MVGNISLSYAWLIFFHNEGTMKVKKFCPVLVFWKWYINFRELFLVLKFQFIQITEKTIGKRFEFMSWLNLYFDQLRDSILLLKIWVIFFRCSQCRPHLLNVISICISFFWRGYETRSRMHNQSEAEWSAKCCS